MIGVTMDKIIIDVQDAKKRSIEDLFRSFSSGKNGLDSAEVEKRLQVYGQNEITEKKEESHC